MAKSTLVKIKRFTDFVVLLYAKWWLTCSLAVAAPTNDLNLVKDILNWHDTEIAESAFKAFVNHLWYLTEEVVMIALWDDNTSVIVKEEMIQKLVTFPVISHPQNRFGESFGKPKMPKLAFSQNPNELSLVNFVGQDSWYFFSVYEIDTSFFSVPIAKWHENNSYTSAKDTLKNLVVVNDVAERGVKLANSFLGVAKNEERYQNILQVVEADRHRKPNARICRKL